MREKSEVEERERREEIGSERKRATRNSLGLYIGRIVSSRYFYFPLR